jgi:Secretion system C-terminal sorting domain/SdrD B-like domain/Bacterial Ig-like domain (group 2)
MKHLNLTILALLLCITSFAQVGAISGPTSICVGTTGTMSDTTSGGTWSSTNLTVATISAFGVATGISAGVTTISYVVGPAYATISLTVNPLPTSIGGPLSVCLGTSITESCGIGGGTWTSSDPTVLTINPATGVITGISVGVATITYTIPTGCYVTKSITVDPLPAAITGTPTVCLGMTTTLSDVTPGGIWASSNTAIATVGSVTGIVTGNSIGATTISYFLGTGCTSTITVTVSASSTVYTVTGGGGYCAGGTGAHVYLSGSSSGSSYQLFYGGTPVGSPVTGLGAPLDFGAQTLAGTYTVQANYGTSCATAMTGSATVSIDPLPTAFTVTGGGGYCTGGTGYHVGLSGSVTGVSYQLFCDGIAVGASLAGTGMALDFGMHTTAGSYTVVATNVTTGCVRNMTGSVTITIYALPAVYSITGGGSYCAGGTGVHIGLSNSDIGVNYQLYNGPSAVGAPVPGFGAAIDFGLQTAAGTYTVVATGATTGCTNNMSGSVTVTVTPTFAPSVTITVTPGTIVCSGTSVTFTAVPTGGGAPTYSWTVNGVFAGTGSSYTYTPAVGDIVGVTMTSSLPCATPSTATASIAMTVTPTITPTATITAIPGTTVCAGATVVCNASITGGGISPAFQWYLNGTPVTGATSSTYTSASFVNGDSLSVLMGSSSPCAVPVTATDYVIFTIDAPVVTASSSSAGCGGSIMLSASGGGSYSWAPSTGLSCTGCPSPTLTPAATIIYTVTGTDGFGCTGTGTVTVDGNRISGFITYTGTPSVDTFKVWLIQFNPSDSSITALDSTVNCIYPGAPYYEFMDKPAGDYLVKARLVGTIPGTSGYIPTYGLSADHWDAASPIHHTSTTTADSMHINMIYGTVPPGPGFIGGFVYAGAGKGTAGEVPVAGMIIYLKNASGSMLTHTYTATDGSYSFSGIANGDYTIYPEDYKYHTTPSPVITLSTSVESVEAVNFKEHTSYGTITPYDKTNVHQVTAGTTGISIFPNPTSGELSIQWENKTTGNAEVIITDMTGREVIRTSVNISTTTGQAHIDLAGISEGVYIITIKAANINYTGRLVRIKG